MSSKSRWGPPPFSWPGIIGLVLATSLGGAWAITLIIEALPNTPTMTDEGADLLNGIGQVLAGAVATYLGSSISRERDTRLDGATRPVDAPEAIAAGGALPPSRSALRRDPAASQSSDTPA